MAQSVLAYQFVDRLRPEIKLKLAQCEGTFEHLLSKVRFQEARLRDVAPTEKTNVQPRSGAHPPKSMTPVTGGNGQNKTRTPTNKDRKCFIYDRSGHFARDCPMKG